MTDSVCQVQSRTGDRLSLKNQRYESDPDRQGRGRWPRMAAGRDWQRAGRRRAPQPGSGRDSFLSLSRCRRVAISPLPLPTHISVLYESTVGSRGRETPHGPPIHRPLRQTLRRPCCRHYTLSVSSTGLGVRRPNFGKDGRGARSRGRPVREEPTWEPRAATLRDQSPASDFHPFR